MSVRRVDEASGVPAVPEELQRGFEELGLSAYEARVLVALLQLGSSNTLQLSQISGVPRPSTYQVLGELSAKRLAQRLPGSGSAVWAAAERDEVLERLELAQEERLRQHKARSEEVRELMAESFPESPTVPLPSVHLLHDTAHVQRSYDKALAEARSELLMFTRPPYASRPGLVNAAVMDMLARGITTRVIYPSGQVEDPDAPGYRSEFETYHEAGVVARVAEEVPIKLVVVDRQVTLVAIVEPEVGDGGYPTTLLVENPDYAQVQADAFEQRWTRARPYSPPTGGGDGARRRPPAPASSTTMAPPPGRRMSAAEAAAYLGLSPSSLYSYVSRGLLHSQREGRSSTFDPAELERFAAGRQPRGRRPP